MQPLPDPLLWFPSPMRSIIPHYIDKKKYLINTSLPIEFQYEYVISNDATRDNTTIPQEDTIIRSGGKKELCSLLRISLDESRSHKLYNLSPSLTRSVHVTDNSVINKDRITNNLISLS